MTIKELLEKIDFPKEASAGVIDYLAEKDKGEYDEILSRLVEISTFEAAWEELKTALGNDEHQRRALALELKAALTTYEKYLSEGIPERVFVDTLKAYTRYAKSYEKTYGEWGFEHASWLPRHLSMRIFRLGTLEYEYKEFLGDNSIVIHIPPDAVLDSDLLDDSFLQAKEFAKKFRPEFVGKRIIGNTWLTSPVLEELLPEGSKILTFKRKFDIIEHKAGESYISSFVFERPGFNPDTDDIDSLPERTSLQRSIKALYKRGGRVGFGVGILKD